MVNYLIEGQIGSGSATAIALEAFIMSSGGEPIELVIDSGGGYVDEAFKMAAIISKNPQIHTKAIFVASAANLLFLAAKRRVVVKGVSQFGIHNCWATISGNANELEDYAQEMRKTDMDMANFYAKSTGKPAELFLKYMDVATSQEFTDFDTETALSLNFATELEEKKVMAFLKPNNKSMQKNEKKPTGTWDKLLAWIKSEKAAEEADVELEVEPETEGDPEEFVTMSKCKEMIEAIIDQRLAKFSDAMSKKMDEHNEVQASVLTEVLKKAKIVATVTPKSNEQKAPQGGEKKPQGSFLDKLKAKNTI